MIAEMGGMAEKQVAEKQAAEAALSLASVTFRRVSDLRQKNSATPAELDDAMQRLLRNVEQGRCPGDDFSDQVIEHGIAPTVARLARGGL